MGIIKRQSIKRSVVSYVGTMIGVVSTIFIYPLDKEIYGFMQFLIGVATFIWPFASLGATVPTIRFFRNFKNSEDNHGFLGFLLLWLSLGVLVFGTLGYFFQDPLFDLLAALNFNRAYFSDNVLTIFLLCILIILIQLMISYTSNFNRIVIPNALFNLGIKLGIPTLVLLYYWGMIESETIKWLLLGLYALILLGLIIYLAWLGGLNWRVDFKFLNRPLLKEMLNYALYGILGSIGTVFAFSIDTIMVAPLTNYDEGGLYSIALFIGNAIAIPLAAINGIAAPIISNAWGKGDRAEIVKIYNRSSVLLFTAGVFLLALVWLSLGDVFRLSSKYEELILGQYVVLIIGLARVIDMITGVNGSIIGYSRYFRFNLLALLVLSFGNVLMNYLLIPKYGITGAAIATAISIALFNIIKFVFIWVVFKMQPVRLTFLWIFLLAVVAYVVSSLLPSTGIPLINIIIRSGLCVLLFAGPLLYLRLVPDINEFVLEAWKKIKKS